MTQSHKRINQWIDEALNVTEASTPQVRFQSQEIIIGETLDAKYRIDRQIGRGGMGVVYDAFEIVTKRRVAIKVIHKHFSAIPDVRKRFQQEAQTMAKISHKNVVQFYHCEVREDGLSYIVMEYVEGKTLRQLLKEQGKLPYAEAMRLCSQMIQALAAIHHEGVLHRDLKPENIMLTKTPKGYFVRICDFGLGKLLETSSEDCEEELTEIGYVLGTPNYMSPEQSRGDKVSEQSDLYSLGIILFEMLTGSPPFKGCSKQSIFRRHQEMSLPIDRLDKNIPKAIRGVLVKTLEKNEVRRYRTAIEMIRALNNVRHTPQKSRFPKLVFVTMLSLVIVSMGAYMVFGPIRTHSENTPPTQMHIATSSAMVQKVPVETVEVIKEVPEIAVTSDVVKKVEDALPVEWSTNATVLWRRAESYSDSGESELYSETLRRFLVSCKKGRGAACSPANRRFARIRSSSR